MVSPDYNEYKGWDRSMKDAFVDRMWRLQDCKCALCGEFLDNRKYPGYEGPVVDHDHKTGAIRGLLHPKCNTDLSVIENRPVGWYEKARNYLRRNGSDSGAADKWLRP